jgi:hypothetical protein
MYKGGGGHGRSAYRVADDGGHHAGEIPQDGQRSCDAHIPANPPLSMCACACACVWRGVRAWVHVNG